MVTDYKGVTFSFKDQKKARRLKRLKLVLLLIVTAILVFFVMNYIDKKKVQRVENYILAGELHKASSKLEKAESSLLHQRAKKELKALLHLINRDFDGAKKLLDSIGNNSRTVSSQAFLDYFSDNAAYMSLDIYGEYLAKRDPQDSLLFYKAMSKTALLNYRESENTIKKMPPELLKSKEKELAFLHKINKELETGKINYIFDVNGKPAAYYDLAKKKTIPLVAGFSFDEFTKEIRYGIKFFHLTLDIGIQGIIDRIFQQDKGSFIMFNVDDTSIVSAYSQPRNSKFSNSNIVFSEIYEPGSIVKIITMMASLRQPERTIFPFQCTGIWNIGNTYFSDWAIHRNLYSYDEAMASSCNIAFARMGLEAGLPLLKETLSYFYFNAGPLHDLFLTFKTGTFNSTLSSDLQLAELSVGLSHITITTFQSGLLSSIVAQNGSFYSPYLIKNQKNLLDMGFYNHKGELVHSFSDNALYHKVKTAMVAVVEDPYGTGKRAKVDFMRFAMKTGTSGKKDEGFDAIITGFFPAEKPRYAFAFRLEGGGKSELKGAQFVYDILNSFRHMGIK